MPADVVGGGREGTMNGWGWAAGSFVSSLTVLLGKTPGGGGYGSGGGGYSDGGYSS
jgi:hypothetical protein